MSGGGGSVTGSDNALGWIILAVLGACLCYGIWYFFQFEIKNVIRWLRWGEMWVVSWVLPQDYTVIVRGRELNFHDVLDFVPTIPYKNLNAYAMELINTATFTPLKWVYGAILFFFAGWAFLKGPETEYRRILDLDGLINVQSRIFPVIKPFIKFNPSDQPVRPPGTPVPSVLPLFSEALGPEEWIAYNQIPMPDGKIDKEAAANAFAQQLGPQWTGAKNLPNYKQALLAAFCLKAARKRKESDALLAKIAECWDHQAGLKLTQAVMKEVHGVLRNKDISKLALGNANRHAFQTTALMRALQTAREQGGVLAPAQFVWLRGYDRELWYPLNNLGRHTYHMEALGAVCHYREERIIDRPIPKPKLGDAVKAISSYLEGITARPIPQLDYTQNKLPPQARDAAIKKEDPPPKKAPKSAGIQKPKAPVRKITTT